MQIFLGQTKLTLSVSCEVDITGAQTAIIKYIKPDGQTGNFNATIIDASIGLIEYEIQNSNELDIIGQWRLWAYVTFSDGKVAAGETSLLQIYNEGKV